MRVIAAQTTPPKRSTFSFCTVLSQQDCGGRARGPVVGRHSVGDAGSASLLRYAPTPPTQTRVAFGKSRESSGVSASADVKSYSKPRT